MANCDRRCPTFRQIELLREKCLACNVCGDCNTFQANGRGAVYFQAADDQELVLSRSTGKMHIDPEVYGCRREERQVTALPIDVEDKIREMTSSFFGLRPIEVLLLHHLANGGNLANFSSSIESLRNKIDGYMHLDKRNAWQMFNRIGRAFGPFRELAGGLIGRGKGGAVRQALRKGITQTRMDFGDRSCQG